MRDFSRLFAPRTIAVVGGGAWCEAIVGAARRMGFQGQIFPVHPGGKRIAGLESQRDLADWTGPIDAAFICVNRHATLNVVAQLRALDAGGAVCFASGFTEAQAEDAGSAGLQAELVREAGDMPLLGPNCYGFINALDGAAIWPDQHGMQRVERGVAILTQSSNIAINLTMQRRGLPIAMMVTCGNMAQTSQADIAVSLLDDHRITALGVHVEGFRDLRQWEALARRAHERGVPVVALKVGASDQAQQATVSHTASLAGSDAGAGALLSRLGFARVDTLPAFLECLKLLHVHGPVASRKIASISCSGGEASLMADLGTAKGMQFPALSGGQKQALKKALGPMVALANPLDYHTYVWRDTEAMARAWAAMTGEGIGMTFSIVDYPHTDPADWVCASDAALKVRAETSAPFAVVATLSELMPEDIAVTLMQGGVVPFSGLAEALEATSAAADIAAPVLEPVLLTNPAEPATQLSEPEAKAQLAVFGVPVPRSRTADTPGALAQVAGDLTAPLVLKGMGFAHKSDHGAVRLGLSQSELEASARKMDAQGFLVEEQVQGGVAELLIGVVRDPAHGFVLTLGAGGVLTELMQDTVSLLIPSDRTQIETALGRSKIAPLLGGYRGKPPADMDAIISAIESVQAYVVAHADTLHEIEINPLICTPDGAVAADALIRKATS
ncbi:acetate--CoA ligase family protein [Arenibacterium sp. CAU 1754]